ncbi:DNA glycosylase [Methanothrix soehngenii]|mgnify:CR=1 FL=1
MNPSILEENLYLESTKRVWNCILKWGENNLRSYPWRDDFHNSYKILIAEIMLHRTRADQVEPVYKIFIKKYPDFKSIANSDQEDIIKDLYPLGLNWRSSQLYKMAKEIQEKYDGIIPKDLDKLIELPGVGPYIASAILCFVHDENIAVLDTNIVRVIGRVFGMKIRDSSRKSKKFKSVMTELISHGEPRKFTLSLIDFAALICKSSGPRCDICSLKSICNHYEIK